MRNFQMLVFLLVFITPSFASAATYYVERDTPTVDGTTFCNGPCKGGDTLILRAGERGNLILQNFNGQGTYITITNEVVTPSKPVTIINSEGNYWWTVLMLLNCKYVDFRGDADPNLIKTDRSKGIIVQNSGGWGGDTPARSGNIQLGGDSHHLKFSYVDTNCLNNTAFAIRSDGKSDGRGIGIHMADNNYGGIVWDYFEIHHNWIHDIIGQGCYLGVNDPYCKQPGEYPGCTTGRPHIRNLAFHHNIIEDTGAEGCDIKGSDSGTIEVYDNQMRRTGKTYVNPDKNLQTDMTAGYKIAWTTGCTMNVHDNYVESTGGPGIYIIGAYTQNDLAKIPANIPTVNVHNNVVVNSGTRSDNLVHSSGIISRYRSYDCDVYDNIVIQSNHYGLLVGQSEDVMDARRNIIADCAQGEVYVAPGTVYTEGTGADANIYYPDAASVGFAKWSDDGDYSNDDFRIIGQVCGNSRCDSGESCSTCSKDCGVCPATCGDRSCNGQETCQTCVVDCGACPAACGDRSCNGQETCQTCVIDCGACQQSVFLPGETIEAEKGLLSVPMKSVSDATASGGFYVSTPTDYQGSVSFTFDIATEGNYIIEARIKAPTVSDDSFYVGFDGGSVVGNDMYTWDTRVASIWSITNVSMRGNGNFSYAQFNPMSWTLSTGRHTLTFYGRESGTSLDTIILKKHQAPQCIGLNDVMGSIQKWKDNQLTISNLMVIIQGWRGNACV